MHLNGNCTRFISESVTCNEIMFFNHYTFRNVVDQFYKTVDIKMLYIYHVLVKQGYCIYLLFRLLFNCHIWLFNILLKCSHFICWV